MRPTRKVTRALPQLALLVAGLFTLIAAFFVSRMRKGLEYSRRWASYV